MQSYQNYVMTARRAPRRRNQVNSGGRSSRRGARNAGSIRQQHIPQQLTHYNANPSQYYYPSQPQLAYTITRRNVSKRPQQQQASLQPQAPASSYSRQTYYPQPPQQFKAQMQQPDSYSPQTQQFQFSQQPHYYSQQPQEQHQPSQHPTSLAPADPTSQEQPQEELTEAEKRKLAEEERLAYRRKVNPLLPDYVPKREAAGLGYGPGHASYFKYISHWQAPEHLQSLGVSTELTARPTKGYRSKGNRGYTPHAAAIGYGTSHPFHYTYLSTKRADDVLRQSLLEK